MNTTRLLFCVTPPLINQILKDPFSFFAPVSRQSPAFKVLLTSPETNLYVKAYVRPRGPLVQKYLIWSPTVVTRRAPNTHIQYRTLPSCHVRKSCPVSNAYKCRQ